MAYIYFNGERYFPLRSTTDDIIGLSYDRSKCYEIDELMALPIALLNNKGYITEMSCSGHGVGDLCCEVTVEANINNLKEEGSFITVQYSSEFKSEFVYWVGEKTDEAFIVFKEAEKFPNIPAGWQYKNKRLSYSLDSTGNPMTIYKQAATALEILMEWIESLPKCHTTSDLRKP